MLVAGIFSSIQGEGNFVGIPATIIYTAGCNIDCDLCATKKFWGNQEEIEDLSITDIVTKVKELNQSLVVITGGEPCIHEELQELVDQLQIAGCVVCVETNGTHATPEADWITCSPNVKTGYNINILCKPNELKYLVTDDFDVDIAIPEEIREMYAGKIWLQPEHSRMQKVWRRCYTIAMADSRLRVGVSLHKLMNQK